MTNSHKNKIKTCIFFSLSFFCCFGSVGTLLRLPSSVSPPLSHSHPCPVAINKGRRSTFAADRHTQLILFPLLYGSAPLPPPYSPSIHCFIHSLTHSFIHSFMSTRRHHPPCLWTFPTTDGNKKKNNRNKSEEREVRGGPEQTGEQPSTMITSKMTAFKYIYKTPI